jgi:hypothetical protein
MSDQDFELVAPYQSDQSEDENDELNNAQTLQKTQSSNRKNTKNKIYVLEHTFFGEREVKLDECWTKKKSYETSDGYKIMYYCNKDRANCKLSAFLLYVNTNEQIQFHVEDGEHSHKSVKKKIKMGQLKEKVTEIIKEGISKPTLVLRKLNEKHAINDVTNEQLSYILSSVKDDMYGSATINLG